MKLLKLISCILLTTTNSLLISRQNFIHNVGVGGMAMTLSKLSNSRNDDNNSENSNSGKESAGQVDPDLSYPLTVKFYSPVTPESCMALSEYLDSLNLKSKQLKIKYDKVFPIHLHIQSGGGTLMPTFYICDKIKSLDTPVYIFIDGFVASAASLISVCGSKRYMTKHSFMLIHQLQSQSSGKFSEMKDEIQNLDFFMENVEDVYIKNSNITKYELRQLLSNELWINSSECLRLGLIDGII